MKEKEFKNRVYTVYNFTQNYLFTYLLIVLIFLFRVTNVKK